MKFNHYMMVQMVELIIHLLNYFSTKTIPILLVNPKQADGSTDFSRKYSRQLTRGYSSMAPMSNEKKPFTLLHWLH